MPMFTDGLKPGEEDRPPNNKDEYMARFYRHYRVSGYGAETSQHMPCPFCAANEWMVYPIISMEEVASKGADCKECGRGAKMVFVHELNSTRFEVVQTSGPDQAEWFEPKMRRQEGPP